MAVGAVAAGAFSRLDEFEVTRSEAVAAAVRAVAAAGLAEDGRLLLLTANEVEAAGTGDRQPVNESRSTARSNRERAMSLAILGTCRPKP